MVLQDSPMPPSYISPRDLVKEYEGNMALRCAYVYYFCHSCAAHGDRSVDVTPLKALLSDNKVKLTDHVRALVDMGLLAQFESAFYLIDAGNEALADTIHPRSQVYNYIVNLHNSGKYIPYAHTIAKDLNIRKVVAIQRILSRLKRAGVLDVRKVRHYFNDICPRRLMSAKILRASYGHRKSCHKLQTKILDKIDNYVDDKYCS